MTRTVKTTSAKTTIPMLPDSVLKLAPEFERQLLDSASKHEVPGSIIKEEDFDFFSVPETEWSAAFEYFISFIQWSRDRWAVELRADGRWAVHDNGRGRLVQASTEVFESLDDAMSALWQMRRWAAVNLAA